jgi:polysaccharide export outer membrane protein
MFGNLSRHINIFLKLSIFAGALFVSLPPMALEKDAVDTLNYRLNTGDKLRIQVYGEDDLSLETRVSDNGEISYPFLGILKVVGMSPGQLAEHIAGKLRGDYLVNPKVSIDIIEYRPFFVNGEVAAPGGFQFQPGITVRKAISLAGGFKERADKDKVFIIREGRPNDKPAPASLDDKVMPGDIITVEESFF